MTEVHDDILMYEYKHRDVTDVADLGRCESADFYELLLALLDVHHSFVVASANIVTIGKECMNVVGTTELIAGATAEPSTTDLSSLVLRQNFLQQIYDSKR